MTRPVESRRRDSLATIEPVRPEVEPGVERQPDGTAPSVGGRVRMSFYLPPSMGPESAPEPTDPAVSIVVDPPRTVAVKRFSWYAPDWRVERLEHRLLRGVERAGYEPVADPFLLRYDDPWTPPFMRRNEVAVELGTSA